MASLVLGTVGAAVGSFFGPIGAQLGWAIGSTIGSLIDPPKGQDGPRLSDLHLQGSSYGAPIPLAYGKVRVAGNIIWQTDLVEHSHSSGGKGGGSSATTFSYSASFAIQLCEGPIIAIPRAWADGRIVFDRDAADTSGQLQFTVYLGTEIQGVDPTMEADKGVGNVPAYRGTAYVVFADCDLTDYGNRIPNLTFEVVTHGTGIPWRVSSFDATSGLFGFQMSATYDGSVITIGDWPALGSIHPYHENYYYLDGTSAGPETTHPIDGGLSGTIVNKHIAVYYSSATTFTSWYVNGEIGTRILGNPAGGANIDATCEGIGVYQNNFVFVPCFDNALGRVVVARFPAPDGIPEGIHDQSYLVGTTSGSFTSSLQLGFGTSDAGKIYVTVPNPGGLGDVEMFEFDEELTLLRHWDNEDGTAPFVPRYIRPSVPFTVYNGMIACENHADALGEKLSVLSINEDSTFTFLAQIPLTVGFYAVRVQNGLLVGRDGVISLDPAPADIALSDIVDDVSERCGVESYDTTALTQIVDGFVVGGQMSGRAAIEALMPAYYFDGVETDGSVVFVVRGGDSIVTIPDDDLAAYEGGGTPPAVLGETRTQEVDLPSKIDLLYLNKGADYQVGIQHWRRMVGGSEETYTLQLAIVLTDTKAKAIADSLGYNAWIERNKRVFFTSRKYANIQPCDVVTVRGQDLRIVDKHEGARGILKFDAVPSRPDLFQQTSIASVSSGYTPRTPTLSQSTTVQLLDIPLIGDTDLPGFYVGVAGADSTAFKGVTLFRSLDGGTNYTSVASFTQAAIMGTATTVLPDFGRVNVFDEASTVTVVIGVGSGDLVSATETAVLNGANEAVIGSEIIQYKNATLTAAKTYVLSGLLRGRRGTEWAISAHNDGERFVLLPVNNVAMSTSDMGRSILYKPVTSGRTLAQTTAVTFVNQGQALRPYSPVLLGGGTDASGNVTLNGTRRTRIGGAWVDYIDVPLSESVEGYVFQQWDDSYTICARITETTVPTMIYTSAQQVTDFGANQATIYFTMLQKGSYRPSPNARGTAVGLGGSSNNPLTPITPYNGNPSIPPPGPTATVDIAMTWPAFSQLVPMTIGQRKVCSFTTGGTIPLTGTIIVEEAASAPAFRHCFIARDSGGTDIVANSVSYGVTATSFIGAVTGGAILAAGTTYYYIFDFVQADGTLSGVPTANAQTILILSNVT